MLIEVTGVLVWRLMEPVAKAEVRREVISLYGDNVAAVYVEHALAPLIPDIYIPVS